MPSLKHPNLPKVTDHFSLPGQGQYLVMAYIEGEDLQEHVGW
jgi:serine/threonine protein kinase